MLVARLYRDFWDWLRFVVGRKFGHKIWLCAGPIWFMDVIDSDGRVTINCYDRNVYRGISSITGLSNYVVLCE